MYYSHHYLMILGTLCNSATLRVVSPLDGGRTGCAPPEWSWSAEEVVAAEGGYCVQGLYKVDKLNGYGANGGYIPGGTCACMMPLEPTLLSPQILPNKHNTCIASNY